MSAAPPGAEGAMMRTGRVGQSAALGGPIQLPATVRTSAAARRHGVLMRINDAGVAARPQAAVDTTEGRPVAGICDFRLGTGADVSPHRPWRSRMDADLLTAADDTIEPKGPSLSTPIQPTAVHSIP